VKYPYLYKKREVGLASRSLLPKKLIGGAFMTIGFFGMTFLVFVPFAKSFYSNIHSIAIVKGVGGDFDGGLGIINALSVSQNLYASGAVLGVFDNNQDTQDEGFMFLSIPSLKMRLIKVETNSKKTDPDKNPIHIQGTALPGSSGNVFITGHSSFRYLFDQENPRTVFSTLDNIKDDDLIVVSYKKRDFIYKVMRKEILNVGDVDIYKDYFPKFLNRQTVTIMTCWPEGTTKYRLLVTASLVEE
jgi:LPXTG-site transpeptidase (sortase) family protein